MTFPPSQEIIPTSQELQLKCRTPVRVLIALIRHWFPWFCAVGNDGYWGNFYMLRGIVTSRPQNGITRDLQIGLRRAIYDTLYHTNYPWMPSLSLPPRNYQNSESFYWCGIDESRPSWLFCECCVPLFLLSGILRQQQEALVQEAFCLQCRNRSNLPLFRPTILSDLHMQHSVEKERHRKYESMDINQNSSRHKVPKLQIEMLSPNVQINQ